MANTFNVFKHRSRSKFDIQDESEKKKASGNVKKKSGTRKSRSAGGARSKKTSYEDTVNISRPDKPRSPETEEKLATATLGTINSKKKAKTVLWTIFLSVVICLIVTALALACFNFVFKVENITVDGVTLYNEEDVLSACGISVGDKMYSVNKADISRRLIARFPYFKSVRIVREIPTGIVIKVSEDTAEYYTSFCGEYCLLSGDMRVLELAEDFKAMKEAHPSLRELKLPRVSSAIVGDEIEYFSPKNSEYISAVMKELLESEAASHITGVDMRSKFNISFDYDGRVTVEIGDADSMEAKIQFALKMLSEFGESAKGYISARSVENGYAVMQ